MNAERVRAAVPVLTLKGGLGVTSICPLFIVLRFAIRLQLASTCDILRVLAAVKAKPLRARR